MRKFIIFFLGFITFSFAKPVIELKNPWVRAVPPTSKNTALFLTIENKGDEEDILLSVKTDTAKMVMIHETVNENGIMKMKHVHHLKIPPKSVVKLEPGGLHIMVMGLKKPLKEGDKVRFTLIFKKTGKITISAPVLRK